MGIIFNNLYYLIKLNLIIGYYYNLSKNYKNPEDIPNPFYGIVGKFFKMSKISKNIKNF